MANAKVVPEHTGYGTKFGGQTALDKAQAEGSDMIPLTLGGMAYIDKDAKLIASDVVADPAP